MSDAPIDDPRPTLDAEPSDPLLAALRQLPTLSVPGAAEARLRARVRERYVRGFDGTSWHSPATGFVGRVAVPAFLAGVVGIYMTWAVAAATALVR